MNRLRTVSVVIPVRNDAPALARCLRALNRQSMPPLEVVVVDNASEDRTAEVARQYGARVVTERRVGIPQAASAGYDAARGEILARLDADSIPGPRWVEQVSALMSGTRWDAVTGVGRFYELPRSGRVVAGLYLGAYYLLCHAALGHRPLWGSNMALHSSAWRQVRDRVHDDDAEVHDDLDLAFALGPERTIRLDRSLVMGVSARALRGRAQMRRRFARAFRTLSVNWAIAPPWQRWARRITHVLGPGRGRPPAPHPTAQRGQGFHD